MASFQPENAFSSDPTCECLRQTDPGETAGLNDGIAVTFNPALQRDPSGERFQDEKKTLLAILAVSQLRWFSSDCSAGRGSRRRSVGSRPYWQSGGRRYHRRRNREQPSRLRRTGTSVRHASTGLCGRAAVSNGAGEVLGRIWLAFPSRPGVRLIRLHPIIRIERPGGGGRVSICAQ